MAPLKKPKKAKIVKTTLRIPKPTFDGFMARRPSHLSKNAYIVEALAQAAGRSSEGGTP